MRLDAYLIPVLTITSTKNKLITRWSIGVDVVVLDASLETGKKYRMDL